MLDLSQQIFKIEVFHGILVTMLHPTEHALLLDLIPFKSVDAVAEGFIQLLNDKDEDGNEIVYHDFPASL